MGPIGGGDAGDEVRDPGSVLSDADAMLAGRARVSVGHVNRALFVCDRYEFNPRGRKDVERVHEGGTDYSEDVFDAIGGEYFYQGLRRTHFLRRLIHSLTCPYCVSFIETKWFVIGL